MKKQKSISLLVPAFKSALVNAGYSKSRLGNFLTISKRLVKFCSDNNIVDYTTEVGYSFLQKEYPVQNDGSHVRDLPCVTAYAIRTIRLLDDFFIHGVFTRAQNIRGYLHLTDEIEEVSRKFERYCQDSGCSEQTAYRRRRGIHKFLNYLHYNDIAYSAINSQVITAYFATLIDYCSVTMKVNQLDMRWFLRFLYKDGYATENLEPCVPNGSSIRNIHIPSVWKAEDVIKLLDAVDRGNPTGKRDYAILMLVTSTGLRVSDIRALTLDDINWDNNSINITQSKTGRNLSLPLLPDTGWAIVDYLQHGRPVTTARNVFVTHSVPIMAFSATSSMSQVIVKYMRLANLTKFGHKHGLHSLRHTLATRLLENGTPLPTIAEILGQVSTDSAKVYLQVDIEHLRKCALNVEVL